MSGVVEREVEDRLSEGRAPEEPRRPARRRIPLLAVGIGLGVASIAIYASAGYSWWMLILWLGSVLTLSAAFWSPGERRSRVAAPDLLALGALIAAFAPLYLVAAFTVPVQVSSDEISIMTVIERYAAAPDVDPFGLSDYFGFPTLVFALFGWIAELVGDIDLLTMRLLHGALGLATVGASYVLFRHLLSRGWAFFGAAVLGSAHSFFMISRMAMRENTAVLVEVVALALLLYGLRHNRSLATFAGGIVAGLGFYVYFPGRAVFPLWLGFLVLVAIFHRRTIGLRKVARLGAIATVAFALMAAPVLIAASQAPPELTQYQRTALLIFPEGRALQQDWVLAESEAEGYRENVVQGLATFNSTTVDHGWIYPNHGHGFVDPLTGGLLWLGVVVTAFRLVRRKEEPGALFFVAGFVVLWLSFAFLVNKAPNYTRLLITLPFAAFFVAQAARAVARLVSRRWSAGAPAGRRVMVAVGVGLLGAIVAWNVAIASDFVTEGRRSGDDIGTTGRYIAGHPDHAIFLAASDRWPYYIWGLPHMWLDRMRMFAHEGQPTEIVEPAALPDLGAEPPFALFMSRALWLEKRDKVTELYPQAQVRTVVSTPGRQLVVVEVQHPS